MKPVKMNPFGDLSEDLLLKNSEVVDVVAYVWGILVAAFSRTLPLAHTDRKYQRGSIDVHTCYAVFTPIPTSIHDPDDEDYEIFREAVAIRVRKVNNKDVEVDIDVQCMKHDWSFDGPGTYSYKVCSPSAKTRRILSLKDLRVFMDEFNAGIKKG